MLLSRSLLSQSRLSNDLLSRSTLKHSLLGGPVYGGGIDEFTKLMLHMNGVNGSTAFTDSSLSPKVVTAYGNAQISTAQSKFGGASGYFDGVGDSLDCGNNADLIVGTGDFTIDLWVRFTNLPADYQRLVSSTTDGFDATTFCLRKDNDTKIAAYFGTTTIKSSITVSVNTWYHIEVARKGGTAYLFIGGVLVASGAATSNLSSPLRYIGGHYQNSSEYAFAYIDEVRISKGIARWTSNFTPPTQEYTV